MRADRLVATLLLMQARGRVTARELSQELEISVATARRDLEALSAAGIPVYPQPGRGGGWQLLGGGRTDLSGLSSAEAQALFLLAGPAAAVSAEAKSALRKLVRALPHTFRDDAEAASSAIVIDPSAWGKTAIPTPAHVDTLQSAIVARRRVELSYANWDAEPSLRTVDPLGVVEKNGRWYLIANTVRGQRTYRVDRMSSTELTEVTFERPPGFDLAEAWNEIVTQVEQRRSAVTATLLAESHAVTYLRSLFGEHCVVIAEGEPTRVTVAAPTLELVARTLAGWSEFVTVESPVELRAELERLGGAVAARHAVSVG
jgi:predicted DNA-binding transcriptional regulator YafY